MFCCRHFYCVRIELHCKHRSIEFLTTQTDQSKRDILIDYVLIIIYIVQRRSHKFLQTADDTVLNTGVNFHSVRLVGCSFEGAEYPGRLCHEKESHAHDSESKKTEQKKTKERYVINQIHHKIRFATAHAYNPSGYLTSAVGPLLRCACAPSRS